MLKCKNGEGNKQHLPLCLRDDRLPKFGCFFEKSLKSEYNVISNKLEILEDALFESSKTSTHKMEKLAH